MQKAQLKNWNSTWWTFSDGIIKKCYQIDENFKNFISQITFLNSYYIETRYSAQEGLVVDKEDAEKCIEYASQVLAYDF